MGRGTSKIGGGSAQKSTYSNPTQDMEWAENKTKYTGTISDVDLRDYANKYNLPTGKVQFVQNGEWIGANGKPVGSYVMADGTHADIQFSRTRKNKFYIETIG